MQGSVSESRSDLDTDSYPVSNSDPDCDPDAWRFLSI